MSDRRETAHDFSSVQWLAGLLGLVLWVGAYLHLEGWSQRVVFDWLAFVPGSRSGERAYVFVLGSWQVLWLWLASVFVLGWLQRYVSASQIQPLLVGRRACLLHGRAALFGLFIPFNPCATVPLLVGLLTNGVSLAIVFTLMVAVALLNEAVLVLLGVLLGWQAAGLYLLLGIAVSMGAGCLLGLLGLESRVAPWVYQLSAASDELEVGEAEPASRLPHYWHDLWRHNGLSLLLGSIVALLLFDSLPDGALASILGREVWWGVPLATLLGAPMYGSAAGLVPVIVALFSHGVAPGCGLALLVSVPALSLPGLIILRQALSGPLLWLYSLALAAGILLVGYVFNALF